MNAKDQQQAGYDVGAAMDAVTVLGEVMAGMLNQLQSAGFTRDEAAAIIVAQQQQAAADALREAAVSQASHARRGLFG